MIMASIFSEHNMLLSCTKVDAANIMRRNDKYFVLE